MFSVDSAGTKTSTMPESWRTFLDIDEDTGLCGYRKFAKVGDVCAFSDPAFVSSGLGKVKVLSGD